MMSPPAFAWCATASGSGHASVRCDVVSCRTALPSRFHQSGRFASGGAPPLANRPLWWNRDGKAVLHETTSQRTLAWPDPDAVAHHAKAGGDIIAVRWPAARSSADSSLSGAGVGFE